MMLRSDRPDLLQRIDVEKIVTDVVKDFIIAHSNNSDLIDRLKNETYLSYPEELPVQSNQLCTCGNIFKKIINRGKNV